LRLDSAGVCAAGQSNALPRATAPTGAAARARGPPAELAPGQLSGWAIGEQILVGRLLDLGKVGVRVTDSGMLVPQKSASIMVGAGPDYASPKVRSPCEYCDLSETCHYRH